MFEDDEVRREGESDPEGDVLSVTEYSLALLLLLVVLDVLVDADDEDDAVDAFDLERDFLPGRNVNVE